MFKEDMKEIEKLKYEDEKIKEFGLKLSKEYCDITLESFMLKTDLFKYKKHLLEGEMACSET